MAATKNLYQLPQSHNSVAARHGVVTLCGYGIQVRVDRGHLIIEDGMGADRRHYRLPRVGHGLKRLVIIGADGQISLAALRWLADQDAAFVMLERDGSVLATTGPVRLVRCKAATRPGYGQSIGKCHQDRTGTHRQETYGTRAGGSSQAACYRECRRDSPLSI